MSDDSQTNRLIIFAKLPEPGKVKTRLAADLGNERAAEIYSQLARDIISRVSESDHYQTYIFYDPPEKKAEVAGWLNDSIDPEAVSFFPQQGVILGERISLAFEKVFSSNADRSVIIGTDCTDLTRELIEDSFKALRVYDAVIGPAEDGGYYLLGLNRFRPELFQDIEWSTRHVLGQTVERLQESGLRYKVLKTLSDIDNLDDLKRISGDLKL